MQYVFTARVITAEYADAKKVIYLSATFTKSLLKTNIFF